MGPATRFALAGGAAAASGAAVVAWGFGSEVSSLRWAAVGWSAAAIPGVAGGAWLARRHGSPGTGFVVALGAGMLVRLVAVLGSLVWALRAGGGVYRPWLIGLVAGYVPLQLIEVIWFYLRGKRAAGLVG